MGEKPKLGSNDRIILELAATLRMNAQSTMLVELSCEFEEHFYNKCRRSTGIIFQVPTMPDCPGILLMATEKEDRIHMTFEVQCDSVLAHYKKLGFEPMWSRPKIDEGEKLWLN